MKGLNSLIDTVLSDLKKEEGKQMVFRGCKDFTPKCRNLLYRYVKTGRLCNSDCEYCKHFKWVIDRAKYYEQVTGVSFQQVLQHWEEQRNYWWLNYYQDCNQPELTDAVHIFDTVEDAKKSFGDKGFRCPYCHGISENPYECTAGTIVKNLNGKKQPCNWKAYGLFRMNLSPIFIKEGCINQEIFTPVAWETEDGE